LNRVTVRIPTALRPFTNGAAEITVDADTLGHALSESERCHPGLSARILTPEGDIRPFVNLFVGETSARFMDGLDTPVRDGAIISIIPAVAGGVDESAACGRA
jgi:molybdopterin converting factor small subunit